MGLIFIGYNKNSVLEYLNAINKHPLKIIFTANIFMRESFQLTRRFFLALNCLKKNKDIIIKKSDKGGKIVVMNRWLIHYCHIHDQINFNP